MKNRIVEELWIYPIKSLPGIQIKEIEAQPRGLAFDRRFMLVDSEGMFITVRKRTDLYAFLLQLADEKITVNHPNAASPLELSQEYSSDAGQVQIWEHEVKAYRVSEMADAWFSELLGEEVSLVTFGSDSHRLISETWRKGEEEVSFADGYPYLIVSRASLNDISARSGMTMDVRRFRPNIVVSGEKPYEEFLWSGISIGAIEFDGLKPCVRCVVTTIDPDSLEQSKEPLKSLANMVEPGKAIFGQHACILEPGMISEGDPVRIHRTKAAPYAPR